MLRDSIEVGVEFASRDSKRENAQTLQVQVALVVFGMALDMKVAIDLDA